MCRVELTTPVSDRVTSQTVTGDDLSFQAVLKQTRPLNALHIVDDKFEYTKYVTSITYLHTASCFLPLANALRKSGPPYDLGLVVIADDTLWLGKGKVLVHNLDQNETSEQHSDQWDEIGQVRRGMRDRNLTSSEKQKENMSFELTDARQRLDEIN
ncbi:hypothetical protein T12_133 [Trichinella patagoniensis]|uniref:Uncharacterized protein n=1 Tax=Trichinella patagoniensis TaxID=990121 RepID=A0A0V0ZR14_9BILA|nr:hypothetical protein T12_133 [Trichinella patagoniensis]